MLQSLNKNLTTNIFKKAFFQTWSDQISRNDLYCEQGKIHVKLAPPLIF